MSRRRHGRLLGLAFVALLLGLTAPAWARDAIVVLGAATRADGTPSPALARRLEQALKVAKAHPEALLVVTGGAVRGPAEGPVMARWLRERGVQAKRIVVEAKARHTGENADFVAPLLARHDVHRVLLVTDRFHVRRAHFHLRWALRELGQRLAKVGRPLTGVDRTLAKLPIVAKPADDGLRGRSRMRRFVSENKKIVRDWRIRRRAKRATRRR